MLGFSFGHKGERGEPDPIDDEANTVLEHPELPQEELDLAKEIKSLEKQIEEARNNRALQEKLRSQVFQKEARLRKLESERIRNKNNNI